MKRYLILGLLIIVLTNIMLFTGVWINRTGLPTSELMLTERELSIPYSHHSEQENSGLLLQIKWRVPLQANDLSDRNNGRRTIDITKAEIEGLGFEAEQLVQKSNTLKNELYWALEYDGELYQKQLSIIENRYQTFLATFTLGADENKQRKKERLEEMLIEEQIQSSRVFFIESAQNAEKLIEKYHNQKNVLIVKGLAKASYNEKNNTFVLHLHTLSAANIMLTRDQTGMLDSLKPVITKTVNKPRYAVEVKWGSRFEPWITNLKKLAD
ncbi:MAG: putative nucleic acid-binding protein [Oceanospirillaceae bacterium]|jgi:predicted nucleic acid-binding protein